MKTTREFHSIAEIANFELHQPGVIKTDPAANEAARRCLDEWLAHKNKTLEIMRRSMPGSVAWNKSLEIEQEILRMKKWLEKLSGSKY